MFFNLFKPKIKAYWWIGVPNFGDALAPLLLERFADIQVEWGSICQSEVLSIGSVLEHVPPLWDGYILGSGKLMESTRLHVMSRSTLSPTVLALRGPLTARSFPGSFALGDPGILADELVGTQEKQWDLGILPHFSDKELVPRFQKLMPQHTTIRVIDPADNPLDVVRQIGACRRMVTSSLHGMIVSDGFGIPRRVEVAKTLAKDGGDFKFRDYSAALGFKWEPGKMIEVPRAKVEDMKFAVYDAYRALKGELK
jgi:pyruvyltransferase